MRFVSGQFTKLRFGSLSCDLRKKYCTCEPGVSRPSGMIFEYSFVCVVPSQPVRDCGTVESHAGTVPLQTTLFSVAVLVAAFVVSTTKHLNLFTPSVANLGSDSWMSVQNRPATRPSVTMPATGKIANPDESMRQLFQVSGSQPPGPVCVPRPTTPGLAMY